MGIISRNLHPAIEELERRALLGHPAQGAKVAVEANQNMPAAAVAPLGRIGEVAYIPWNERTMDASGKPAQEPE